LNRNSSYGIASNNREATSHSWSTKHWSTARRSNITLRPYLVLFHPLPAIPQEHYFTWQLLSPLH
jgi:hypothetical protein